MVKVYLSRKGVPFTEKNISEDAGARQSLLGMGYRTTPLTIIGAQRIVGYNPMKLEAAIKAAS